MTSTTSQTPATFADLPALMSLMTGDDKHDQAATSTLDVLWVLYDRVLGLGVVRPELRRYGTPAEHQAAHGLDARSLRTAISGFLAA